MIIPKVDDVDRIIRLDDPIVRNLQITQCYYEISQSVARFDGHSANWCTFATWASKQAGQTIRTEDLVRTFEERFYLSSEISVFLESIVNDLRTLGAKVGQIKEKEEFLQARETALAKFEEASNAKFAELESRIQDREAQLKNREIQLQHLASERDFLVGRLRETEVAAEQAETRAHQHRKQMEAEFTDLRLQLEKREESFAARELALSRYEGDLRTSIQNLQLRLQETEAKLASRERELKQKECFIDAAALRETEIGRLNERLSSECEKLSAELCEKRLLIGRLQEKTRHSTNGGKKWKRVLGLEQGVLARF